MGAPVTRSDVLGMEPGDSIIGLRNRWDDECVITAVHRLDRTPDGRARRAVDVKYGSGQSRGIVLEGDSTILGRRRF